MKLYIIELVQWKSFKVAMKKGRLENTTRILEMSVSAAWFYKIFQLEIIKHRQKLVMLADSSELGWRVVHEYETNPIASDSEDEKRIFKAEARANRNANAEKSKKEGDIGRIQGVQRQQRFRQRFRALDSDQGYVFCVVNRPLEK